MADKKKGSKSKKDKVKKIQENIELAFNFQDEDDWKDKSERFLDFFKGKYHSKNTARKRFTVNSVYNFVNLIVPNLAGVRDPFIRVKPKSKNIFIKTPTGEDQAVPTWRSTELMESVLNKTLNDIRFAEEIRKCVQDTMFYGFGVMKVGYGVETETDPNIESPEESDDTTRIKEEGIFVMRVSPLDFGFDPAATDVNDARYLVHRTVKPIDEVRDSDVYKNTDEENLKAELPINVKKRAGTKEAEIKGEFATIFEYHDLLKNEISTVSKSSKKFLRDPRENPHDFTGSHFVILKFAGDIDAFRGIPMIEMVEDEAVALNETVTKMIRHLDIFPGQVIAEKGALDEDEMQLWVDGEQGSILPVGNTALRENRVQKHPPVPMGNDYFNVINSLQSLMDRVLGIPDFQRPRTSGRKSATEATFEQSDASIRREYFLGFVKDFILNITGKVAALIQQYYDRERTIRVEGETGFQFVDFTKDDIAGEFDFDFDVQSVRFMSQSRVQQLINALNIMAAHPALQPMLREIDTSVLSKELFQQMDLNIEQFKKRPEVAHLEFDPEQENEFVRNGKRILDPRTLEDHRAHLEIHMPFVEEMQAAGDNQKADEMLRHAQMHQFLMGVLSGQINPKQLQQLQQGQQQQGPGFQPEPQAAQTEPELAGGFTSNLSQ
jgi:hypothetical protein